LPEGHSVHRSANDFKRLYVGEPVLIDSPQGRFSSQAKLISGRTLVNARAIGKQLFLEFDNSLTLRIHLGIYGKWRTHPAGDFPEVVGEVRARFSSSKAILELRGPTVCEVLNESEVAKVEKRLGPDPLNPDPRGKHKARFVEKVLGSKISIGQLLMNQHVVSGIGNVYRAELLFRAGISPHTAGNQLPRELAEALWDDSVKLMKVGVKTSFMITRDELFTKRPSKSERNWVYKREGQPCRACDSKISLEMMVGRKLYWCPTCQR
jgi:DNA-formamidopyrimidine glycosylase